MPLTKNSGRVDHVVINVTAKNFDACVDKLTRVLGITFDPKLVREDLGVMATVAWEAGIEVLAPLKEEGFFWERIQKRGEGFVSFVFGVEDFETSCKRAADAGLTVGKEIGLLGDEPWFDRFSLVREAGIGPIFGTNIILGQLEPRN